jgi:hypothetical protein
MRTFAGAGMTSLIGHAAELFRAILHSPYAAKRFAPLLHVLVASSCALLPSFADFTHILQGRCSAVHG